jgi:predicted RNA-binding Zn-ribbon protein involved in translation (DUF1610 family)
VTTSIIGRHYKLFDETDKKMTSPNNLASLLCPKCGEVGMISTPHTIDSHGNVSPEWRCPQEHCGFVDTLQLQEFVGAK